MLTPSQQRTLEALRRTDADPVEFDAGFVAALREDASRALTELTARLDAGRSLAVNKFNVADVLTCEHHFLHPRPFRWSPPVAGGKVAHRAIELLLNWRGEATPADVVDEALVRLREEDSTLADWLATTTPGAWAELRGRAVTRVTHFVECFPPLRRTWHPLTEAQVRWPACGPIVLRARADVVIGRPAGTESRKVLIDLKSGGIAPRHRDDLRYYALVETLARSVPPRLLASFSLEAGEAIVEPVTEGVLRTALRRTCDAVERMIELQVEGRRPQRPPSAGCYRCRELENAGSADDSDLVADSEVVPHRHGVERPQADAA